METKEILDTDLSEENLQNLYVPQRLYDFLKQKYGVSGTEKEKLDETIFCHVQVELPGFIKASDNNFWTIQLEKVHEETNLSESSRAFILVEHWPDSNIMYSRFIEIQSTVRKLLGNHPPHAGCWFKVVENMFCEKGNVNCFLHLSIFSQIFYDFLQQL